VVFFHPSLFTLHSSLHPSLFTRRRCTLQWHRMLRRASRLLAFLAAVGITVALSAAPPDPTTAIATVLDAQVAAWNRGDLEGYMTGYWQSPQLEFYSGATVTRGWQETLDRYRKRYQGEGKEMGKLTFANLRIDVVTPDEAVVCGEWHLDVKSGPPAHGLFTLILKRLAEGWRIVHDHSS
jgi:ketosteroid isomerase-like protein